VSGRGRLVEQVLHALFSRGPDKTLRGSRSDWRTTTECTEPTTFRQVSRPLGATCIVRRPLIQRGEAILRTHVDGCPGPVASEGKCRADELRCGSIVSRAAGRFVRIRRYGDVRLIRRPLASWQTPRHTCGCRLRVERGEHRGVSSRRLDDDDRSSMFAPDRLEGREARLPFCRREQRELTAIKPWVILCGGEERACRHFDGD